MIMTKDSKKPQRKRSVKKLGIVLVVVLLVAGATVGGFLLYLNYGSGIREQTQEDVEAERKRAEGVFKEIDAEAIKIAQAAVEAAQTPEDKAAAYRDLSGAYSVASDYKKAFEYAVLAAEADSSVDSYKTVVSTAELAGDKAAAETARQKVTELGGWPDETE